MYDPKTGVYELEADKPLILLLGKVNHEGVLSKLQASNRQYKSKFLESKVKNWESILKYFDDYVIDAVLIKGLTQITHNFGSLSCLQNELRG